VTLTWAQACAAPAADGLLRPSVLQTVLDRWAAAHAHTVALGTPPVHDPPPLLCLTATDAHTETALLAPVLAVRTLR
jgi:hypothetical protein